jgi:hypothetical protein
VGKEIERDLGIPVNDIVSMVLQRIPKQKKNTSNPKCTPTLKRYIRNIIKCAEFGQQFEVCIPPHIENDYYGVFPMTKVFPFVTFARFEFQSENSASYEKYFALMISPTAALTNDLAAYEYTVAAGTVANSTFTAAGMTSGTMQGPYADADFNATTTAGDVSLAVPIMGILRYRLNSTASNQGGTAYTVQTGGENSLEGVSLAELVTYPNLKTISFNTTDWNYQIFNLSGRSSLNPVITNYSIGLCGTTAVEEQGIAAEYYQLNVVGGNLAAGSGMSFVNDVIGGTAIEDEIFQNFACYGGSVLSRKDLDCLHNLEKAVCKRVAQTTR